MTATFKEEVVEKIRTLHNSTAVINFYKERLMELRDIFIMSEVYPHLLRKQTRIPKTDPQMLHGAINLFYHSMKLSNDISFDKIDDKTYSTISCLTYIGIIFIMIYFDDSKVFNDILYSVNEPDDNSDYESERRNVFNLCIVKLILDLYGITISDEVYELVNEKYDVEYDVNEYIIALINTK